MESVRAMKADKDIENFRKKINWSVRLVCLAVAVGCGGLIAAAVWLRPATGGYGTHIQLGFPSCGFLARTGYPCFGCGMTTSFSAMAHGQIGLAFSAQPIGAVGFVAVAIAGIAGLIELLTGWALLSRLRPRFWWIGLVVGVVLTGWACKLLIGVAAGKYPIGR